MSTTRISARAVLFGSAARGEGSTRSDVDILIVHPGGQPPSDEVLDSLRGEVAAWTGNHAHVVVVGSSRWLSMKVQSDPLVESIETEGFDLLAERVTET